MTAAFPIPILEKFQRVQLDPNQQTLSKDQREALLSNIQLFRDALIFFTSTAAARGLAGHTGGPYDTAPEVCLLLALYEHDRATKAGKFVDTVFDEAGHRVATQYLLSALDGHIPIEHLLHYRQANSKLPGHPELGLTPGVKFSSGRLGHLWPFVNGVAFGNPDKIVTILGSDGSQQEGNDAEAARIAVANNLNVKLFIDNNDVTIAGHPSQYEKGFLVAKTLEGHGLKIFNAEGENIDSLWKAISQSVTHKGPTAVISNRKMAPGIAGLEGEFHAHDVIPVDKAISYLKTRGYGEDVTKILSDIKPGSVPYHYVGVTQNKGGNRVIFGEAVSAFLDKLGKDEAKKRVMVIDSDLEGSTGLKAIHQKHPEVFVPSGVMERGNFSAAAGYGFNNDRVAIFSTFAAFLEMVLSEITMARLNFSNVLCHFSHSGVDEIADNSCHFGALNFAADNGLADGQRTLLFFPADGEQMKAVVNKVFWEKGLRFIFSTRSKVPYLLKEGSKDELLYGGDYQFEIGKDEWIRKGKAGVVVAFGEMVYRALDAVERLRSEGMDVGLVNKPTLNIVDEQAIKEYGSLPFVLVVESQNRKNGLGVRMGTWLLERGLTPRYSYLGTTKEGCGGLEEQIYHQGLDPQSIIAAVRSLEK